MLYCSLSFPSKNFSLNFFEYQFLKEEVLASRATFLSNAAETLCVSSKKYYCLHGKEEQLLNSWIDTGVAAQICSPYLYILKITLKQMLSSFCQQEQGKVQRFYVLNVPCNFQISERWTKIVNPWLIASTLVPVTSSHPSPIPKSIILNFVKSIFSICLLF